MRIDSLLSNQELNEIQEPENSYTKVGNILSKCRSILGAFDHSSQLKELLEEQQRGKNPEFQCR